MGSECRNLSRSRILSGKIGTAMAKLCAAFYANEVEAFSDAKSQLESYIAEMKRIDPDTEDRLWYLHESFFASIHIFRKDIGSQK